MKKIFLSALLIFTFGALTISCNSNDDDRFIQEDRDTVSQVYEYRGVSFQVNDAGFFFYDTFRLNAGESMLIYMQSDLDGAGNSAWVLLPNDIYYFDGAGYNFYANYDFTGNDFKIYISPNGANVLPNQVRDITFRVVVIPGYVVNGYSSTKSSPVDYNNYNAVIKYYNIDESKMIKK